MKTTRTHEQKQTTTMLKREQTRTKTTQTREQTQTTTMRKRVVTATEI